MRKDTTSAHTASTGRIVSMTIGEDLATKFAEIEGFILSKQSAQLMSRLEKRGLKGDALRKAILHHFIAIGTNEPIRRN